MNEVRIGGNLVRDPELRFLTTGTAKCSFTIAHNTGKDDKKRAHFFDCVAWKTTGEAIVETFKKGQYIEVQGMLTQNNWEQEGVKKSRIEIVVFKVIEKEKKETAANPPPPAQGVLPGAEADMPF
jgi:single-strand DNA-binding protein